MPQKELFTRREVDAKLERQRKRYERDIDILTKSVEYAQHRADVLEEIIVKHLDLKELP